MVPPSPLLPQDLGKGVLLQLLERVAVPEERGYVDEDVLEERLHLGRLVPQQAHVLLERRQAAQRPSVEPAAAGCSRACIR